MTTGKTIALTRRRLCGTGVTDRTFPTSKARNGNSEEIHHVQGKEQQLCFAGAAKKRYPTSNVGAERASEGRQTETTITDN